MKTTLSLLLVALTGCGYTLQKESDVPQPPKNVVCWQAGKEVYTASAATVTREPGKLVVEGIRVNDAVVDGLKIELYDGESFCAVVTATKPLPQKPPQKPAARRPEPPADAGPN